MTLLCLKDNLQNYDAIGDAAVGPPLTVAHVQMGTWGRACGQQGIVYLGVMLSAIQITH